MPSYSAKYGIKQILENETDAQRIIFELSRLGKKVSRHTVINEIIYELNNVPKDREILRLYYKGKIILDGQKHRTTDVFVQLFGKKKDDAYSNINKALIGWAFGEDIAALFNYTQGKLNATGMQRFGGESQKDAFIFVHSCRTLGIAAVEHGTTYQKRLALLHDLHEEMLAHRQETIKSPHTLDSLLAHPPENHEIRTILKQESESEKEIFLYHLNLLTKDNSESYDAYVARILAGCHSKYITEKVSDFDFKNPRIDELYTDPINIYAGPLIAKCADALDNTRRARDMGITLSRLKRLQKNLQVIEAADAFYTEFNAPPILKRLRQALVQESKDDIKNWQKTYRKDEYYHIQQMATFYEALAEKYQKL